MSKLINVWRCLICEILVGWAIKIAPKDYTPSFVESCVEAYRHSGAFANINRILDVTEAHNP